MVRLIYRQRQTKKPDGPTIWFFFSVGDRPSGTVQTLILFLLTSSIDQRHRSGYPQSSVQDVLQSDDARSYELTFRP